jgi:hypothetical protein
VAAAFERTSHEDPRAATHWTLRSRARRLAPSTIHRPWCEHSWKSHQIETVKLSNCPRFLEKVYDIVGLYINPLEHAMALSVGETSQIQALGRTQPGLPMKRCYGATTTRDYIRHGRTTLFAALDVQAGTAIKQCILRHRAVASIRFLRLVDKQMPSELDLHAILNT